jgi:hypothetical protein
VEERVIKMSKDIWTLKEEIERIYDDIKGVKPTKEQLQDIEMYLITSDELTEMIEEYIEEMVEEEYE